MTVSGYQLKLVRRDGKPVTKFQCPQCSLWGDIDEDQFYGRVSIQCPECTFHETIDLSALVEKGEIVVINLT